MTTSLVTGAAGFLGSHLVDALVARGETVLALDILPAHQHLGPALASNRVRFLALDLANDQSDTLERFLAANPGKIDAIWHLAANSNIRAGMADPSVDLRDTFLTTLQALAIARKHGVPEFYFTSSSAVYGERHGRIEEDAGPFAPISNYGAMKLASEAALSAASASFLTRGTVFRLPNVVGCRLTHGVLYDFLAKLEADPENLEVLGDGSQRKPYLHIGEVLEAILYVRDHADRSQAGSATASRVNTFNLGPSDEGIPLRTLVNCLLGALGSNAAVHYQGGDRGWPGDIPRYSYSTARVNRLGWHARMSSLEAVQLACAELARAQAAGRTRLAEFQP